MARTTTVCPKCAYLRKPDDTAPEWECPACGVVYAKFIASADAGAEKPLWQQRQERLTIEKSAAPALPFNVKAAVWIVAGVLSVVYFAYERISSPTVETAGGRNGFPDTPPEMASLQAQAVPRLKPESSARLAKLSSAKVVMFSTSWCPYCAKAREFFQQNGVTYVELDVERDAAAAEFQRKELRTTTVPTIVVGDRLMRGFSAQQLAEELKEI
jgi:glutaredoxin